ncbi:MAG: response regulator [Burkholderiales bacterium]|nr:response regulator [Burkholderiales bacterium]
MPTAAAPPDAEAPGTILCIEDHPVSMELVEAMLANFPGITLIKADTGREGVRLALESPPDLILLDMNLPDISGLEVVRALNEPIAQRRFRVILLTADSFSIDVVKAMSLGAHAYWHKPLTSQRVFAELPRALQGARADRQRMQARGARPS